MHFRSLISRHQWELSILTIGGLLIYLSHLSGPMRLWDEASYATISHYASAHGYWLIPHIPYYVYAESPAGVQPFLEKPPLGFWLQGISMLVFGQTEIAARIPSSIATVATAIVVYAMGVYLYCRRVAIIAATILLATPQLLLGSHGGRAATLDSFLLLFGTAFLGALIGGLREQKERLLLLAGVCFGAGVLSKGFAMGIFAFVAAPIALLYRKQLLSKAGAKMIVASCVVFTPWLILAALTHPDEILIFAQNQVIKRVSGDLSTYDATFEFMSYPYFRRLPDRYEPWLYLFLPAAATVPIIEFRDRVETRFISIFFVYWAVFVFAFFMLVGNHGWYIQPMAPAVAVLCAIIIDRGWVNTAYQLPVGAGLIGVVVYSDTVDTLASAGTVLPPSGVRVLVAVGGLAGLALSPQLATRVSPTVNFDIRRVVSLCLAIAILAHAGTVLAVAGPYENPAAQQQMEIGEAINTADSATEPLLIQQSIDAPLANLVFFADRPTTESTINELNDRGEGSYAVVKASAENDIKQPYTTIGALESEHYPRLIVIKLGEN